MSSENPTAQELIQGFKECETCKDLLLFESGFEVKTSVCTLCGEHVASADEFFNVPV